MKFLISESEDPESELSAMADQLIKKGFKKFVSNRFGRMSSLSKTFIEHKPVLEKFFDEAETKTQTNYGWCPIAT